MAMLGQRKPFDPNAPQFMTQPDVAAAPPLMAPQLGPIGDLPTLARPAPKHNWVGILADALSGLAGNGPVYAPLAARRQDEQTAFERGEEQYQRRRKDNLSDQMTLLEYKQAHPDDQLTEYLNAAGITDPAERQRYYRQKADAMTAPPMMSAAGVDEQGNPVMRFFPRAAPANTAPGAPAVGTIKGGYRFKGGNPGDPSAWEQVGGQTPPASGTFR